MTLRPWEFLTQASPHSAIALVSAMASYLCWFQRLLCNSCDHLSISLGAPPTPPSGLCRVVCEGSFLSGSFLFWRVPGKVSPTRPRQLHALQCVNCVSE